MLRWLNDIDVDFVVLSMGCRPDNALYEEIKDSKDYKVFNIGDSVKVGRIANATESAYQAVMSIDWFTLKGVFMGKKYNALVFNFGPDEDNYYIIDEYLFKELVYYLDNKQKGN